MEGNDMIYKYDVIVPLIYNRHELYTKHPDSENRFEFDSPVTYQFKIGFLTYDIPGSTENGYLFRDSVSVKLYNVYEEERESAVKRNPEVKPEFICEINGLLVDDEIYARKFAEEIADKICKELSFVLIRHNHNRYYIQPRVEAAWSRARFSFNEYQPFIDEKRKAVSDSDGVIHVEDHMRVVDSVYITAFSRISASEVDIESIRRPHSETVEYLMNEYYSALGAEMVKSKFFHLFSMIEYCEREYRDHNGASRIWNEEAVDDILDCLKQHGFESRESENNAPEDKKKKNKEEILSRIKKSFIDITDIGRNKKLLNILKWMKIEKYTSGGTDVMIDEALIRDLTRLRNKSFHGTAESSQDADDQYKDAVGKLMYIGEQILNYVRSNEPADSHESKIILITGKR